VRESSWAWEAASTRSSQPGAGVCLRAAAAATKRASSSAVHHHIAASVTAAAKGVCAVSQGSQQRVGHDKDVSGGDTNVQTGTVRQQQSTATECFAQ
jgi:hypothetical protein